ncbi:hypothetical protein [Nocardia sp. NPDC048505]|uniref:hypothetical protein n=1 Tax=unclassified Nocardia TaxID=2637762 RepID=UPI0033CE13C2
MTSSGPEAGRVSPGAWIARAIAVVLLVPLRLLWEGLKLIGRVIAAAARYFVENLLIPVSTMVRYWVIRPLWLFVKNLVWGWLVQQVLWGLVLTPALALILDFILRPLRRAVEEWLWRRVLRPAAARLCRWVLYPVGRAVVWAGYQLARWLVLWPLAQLWRRILRPLWKALRATVVYAWRVVGVLVVIPCRFLHRTVLGPMFRAFALAWRAAVVRPVRRLHATVIVPMNRWAAEVLNSVFGR